MAVGLWIMFSDGTQEKYEATNRQMDVEANPPDGLILHSAGPAKDGGWSIVDFWESRDQFDRFVADRLGPTSQELGDGGMGEPEVKEFPVANIIKP